MDSGPECRVLICAGLRKLVAEMELQLKFMDRAKSCH